jgi:hypothetical protein
VLQGVDELRRRLQADPSRVRLRTPSGDAVLFEKGKDTSFVYGDGDRRVGAVVGFYKAKGEVRGVVLWTDGGELRRYAFDKIDLNSVE